MNPVDKEGADPTKLGFENPEKYIREKLALVDELLQKLRTGELSSTEHFPLLAIWQKYAPEGFKLRLEGALYTPIKDEFILNDFLINMLERFIFANNADAMHDFLTNNECRSVCAKIFKEGDPFYSCLDCEIDPTCCICVSCFKESAHRNHNYKMSTSSGGGFCDCGDIHSWKNDAHCNVHIKGLQNTCESTKYPEDVMERAEILIRIILNYCYEVLRTERSTILGTKVNVGKLELDLSIPSCEDNYCTLVSNCEVHSHEQVADAVSAATGSHAFQSLITATFVDKKGRAIVRNSTYNECNKIRKNLRRIPPFQRNGLKVRVYHWNFIAHQSFALHLLSWLEQSMKRTKQFRELFSKICLNTETNTEEGSFCSVVKLVLLNDSYFWNSARQHWHNVFMSLILADHHNKVEFSKVFTKHYSPMLKNYIKDDHGHADSITSLSVQLFTIPSIAKLLIESENVLSILFDTFLTQLHNNQSLSLSFSSTPFLHFLRTLTILRDVGYILNVIPDEWNDDLRKNFVSGFFKFLRICSLLQEMGTITKQLDQHIEFEPEWRNELKLQSRITPVIASMVKWCSSDKLTMIKAMAAVIKAIYKLYYSALYSKGTELTSFKDHNVMSFKFNSATDPVSLHLPYLRLFAALYLKLKDVELDYSSPEFAFTEKLTPLAILEPVLRTQAMIAEVQAGMWKKNGLSLPTQITLYKSKYRQEMYDRDLSLLQICASLIESNEFLINVLNRFNLISWFKPDIKFNELDEDVRNRMILIQEEFLLLLIYVISERYCDGVGKVSSEECLKYEAMHRLFLKSHTRSDLVNVFPVNCEKSTMNHIIDEIATFNKQNGSATGIYIIKKELWHSYNAFFYHYSKEEKSVAEREEKRNKSPGTFYLPPKLPEFTAPFKQVACLLHCDVLLEIMKIILTRSQSPQSLVFSELHVHMVLYLIGYAVQFQYCENCKADFIEESKKWNIVSILENIGCSKHTEMFKDLILWILKRYKSSPVDSDESGGTVSKLAEVREKCSNIVRSTVAAERQAAILKQMQMMQQKFIKNYSSDLGNDNSENESSYNNTDTMSLSSNVSNAESFTCIICQKSESGPFDGLNGSTLVSTGFMQKSILLSRKNNRQWIVNTYKVVNEGYSVHISSCGHFMHADCWVVYFERSSNRDEEGFMQRLRDNAACDKKENEYFCPLCKTLCNTILPVVPKLLCKEEKLPFSTWLELIEDKYIKPGPSFDSPTSDAHLQAGTDLSSEELELPNAQSSPCVTSNISIWIQKWLIEYIPEVGGFSNFSHVKKFLLTWHSCAYTIQSLEMLLQRKGKPLFGAFNLRQEVCIQNLVRVSAVIGSLKRKCKARYTILRRIMELLLVRKLPRFPRLFQYDCFDLLVFLTLSIPGSNTTSKDIIIDKNIFKTILLLKFATILLSENFSEHVILEEDITSEETACLIPILKLFRPCKGINTVAVWNLLKLHSLPFLRSVAIFYHFLSGIDPPQILKEIEGNTYENIVDFIGIPARCQQLFKCQTINKILSHWAKRAAMEYSPVDNKIEVCNKLIDLPYDYSDLIDRASLYVCPKKNNDDGNFPALCLLCGELLCSNSYCCQKILHSTYIGPCTYHTSICGPGYGIFLQIRECQLLLLSSKPIRGCFKPAPYFDEYGEADQGLLRGNPLFLNKEKYKEFEMLWLSHAVHEEISRSLELASDDLADWGVF